jgi:hypothetical protein
MMLAILPWIESPYAFKMDIYVALALIVAGILMVAAARRKPAV